MYEKFRKGKFIETKSRLVVDWGWIREQGLTIKGHKKEWKCSKTHVQWGCTTWQIIVNFKWVNVICKMNESMIAYSILSLAMVAYREFYDSEFLWCVPTRRHILSNLVSGSIKIYHLRQTLFHHELWDIGWSNMAIKKGVCPWCRQRHYQ